MSITDILIKMSWWYYLIIFAFSSYYAYRGFIEKKLNVNESWTQTQKVIIDYIQEVLFKVIVTISSFIALFIANYISSSLESINDIGVGTAVILIFLFIWGIIGACGYLTSFIASGKIPGIK